MIVTANNYHINLICIKLNVETLLGPSQTFLTSIASVRYVSLTSEYFFNLCFRRFSNDRTNPQGDPQVISNLGIDVSKK